MADFLVENFDRNPTVESFTIEKVFKEKGFGMIRSFLNSCIGKIIYESRFQHLKELIHENITILHVAASEKNLETFELFLSCIVHNLVTKEDKEEAKKALLSVDEMDTNMLFYYYRHCDDNLNLMEFLKTRFDLDFVKELLNGEYVNDILKGNIAVISSWHGTNYLKLFEWILREFSQDLTFLRKMILSADHVLNNILHNTLYKFRKDEFFQLLEILGTAGIDKATMKSLLTMKNIYKQNFLSYVAYADELFEDDQSFLKTLDWLKKQCDGDRELLHEIINSEDVDKYSLIHYFIHNSKKKYVPKFLAEFCQWTKDNLPDLDMKEYLMRKNIWEQNFLNLIVVKDANNEATASLIQVLDWLKKFFRDDEQTLKEMVLNKYNNNEYLVGYYTEKCKKKNLPNFIKKFCEWLKNNLSDVDLTGIFKHRNRFGRTFLFLMMFHDYEGDSAVSLIEILDWLKEEFGVQLVSELLETTDADNYLLIHFFAESATKHHFPKVMANLCTWIRDNLTDFDLKKFLSHKTRFGHNFIFNILPNDPNNEAQLVTVKTLNWLKREFSKDQDFLKELVLCTGLYNENMLHYAVFRLRKGIVGGFLRDYFGWIAKNIENFEWKKYLLQLHLNGGNFLCFIFMNDSELEALTHILDWLHAEEIDAIEELLAVNNPFKQNFLHLISQHPDKGYALTVFNELFRWFKDKRPNIQLRKLLMQADFSGKNFYDYLNVDEAGDEIKEAWRVALDSAYGVHL